MRLLSRRTLIIVCAATCGTFIAAIGIVIAVSTIVINQNKRYIIDMHTTKPADAHTQTGLVLGAGITPDGKPYKELAARLNTAAEALQAGYVDRLIVSGDNRFKNYDEPTAMKNYLVNTHHIDPRKIQPDYAGRSTYESCERATKIFGQTTITIISAQSHLPRAIYLCRHMGIETYGIGAKLEANNSTRREALARVKAVYNLYIRPEPTVLGKRIKI